MLSARWFQPPLRTGGWSRSRRPRASDTDVEKGRPDCRGLSEARVAALALEGHSAAWDEIARRHSHRVRLALLARGVPLEAAQDLVQEVWLRLIRKQRAGRLRSLTLPGLAGAQAVWLAREEGRTKSRREAILRRTSDTHDDVDDDAGANPEERAIQSERLDRIRQVL